MGMSVKVSNRWRTVELSRVLPLCVSPFATAFFSSVSFHPLLPMSSLVAVLKINSKTQ